MKHQQLLLSERCDTLAKLHAPAAAYGSRKAREGVSDIIMSRINCSTNAVHKNFLTVVMSEIVPQCFLTLA